jgi:ATP/maltotriose-dependent transcriptional regulator MalT/DNA-binding SARP family transcriptional activator
MATRAAAVTAAGEPGAALIAAKVRVPPIAERLIDRPRLDELVVRMLALHRPLFVYATAGSGKTTAVAQSLRDRETAVAWLTVDSTDAAPGRLLTYLEAAVAAQVPAAAGVATAAMRQRVPQREAAGLLAEAAQGAPLVLVVDELERLAAAPDALAVLAAFVRYAPPTLRLILISRQELALDLSSDAALGGAAAIREEDLAFTADEAEAALATIGSQGIDPAEAIEATGGWVAGVLFEAWRSSEHVAGIGGEADPLHGYLASQVLEQLEPDEQELLVRSALLTDVTPSRAEALGCDGAASVMSTLRMKHLPVTWRGEAMRCHTRFREYLLARLERRPGADVRALRRSHGRLLESEGHLEDAVEAFLAAGSLESALHAAEGVLDAVVERLDFAVAERWLQALRPIAAAGDDTLTRTELMLAIAREHYGEAARVADRLRDAGELDLVVARSDHAAKMLAWCLWHVGRIDDARDIVGRLEDEETGALRYLLHLVDMRGAAVEPELTGGPLDALTRRVRYAHGRLRDAADPPASRWAAAVTAPWRIGALRALGRLDEALALYEGETFDEWAPVWFGAIVAPELMTDLGRERDAREAILRGRALIRESGSVVFAMLNRLIEAKLELRLAQDHERADAVLLALAARPEAAAYGFVAEQVATWSGMVLLLRNQDEAAARRLRRAVRTMQSTDRILELPTAAVFLAEAEWRLGNDDAADTAADLAAAAAGRQGSDHLLLQALADFPAVASRRLDADADADSRWHDLGRALLAQQVPVTVRGRCRVAFDEFAGPELLVDDVVARPRIKKSYELLAYLLGARRARVARGELLGAILDGRTDGAARSYLRQAAHQLREVLPDDVGPVVEEDQLRLQGAGSVESAYARLEGLLARAAHLPGVARLELLEEALQILERGEYLAPISSPWVVERRERLARVAADVRHDAAKAAYSLGRYQRARELVEEVVRGDPYRESSWRLLMRIGHALGDGESVVAAFRHCERALRALGAAPSPTTQSLLAALRK